MDTNATLESENKIAGLVWKLIQSSTETTNARDGKKDSQAQTQLFHYLMKILSSRLGATSINEVATTESIKKKMKEPSQFQRASEILSRLSEQTTNVKNLWSILHVLNNVSLANQNQVPLAVPVPSLESVGFSPLQELTTRNFHFLFYKTEKESPNSTPTFTENSETITSTLQKQLENCILNELTTVSILNVTTVTFEISEELLVRDIIFAFQGIEGKYIKYDNKSDGYLIDGQVGANKSTRDAIGRLCEIGSLFRKIRGFVEISLLQIHGKLSENSRKAQVGVSGLVGQSFCSAIQEELTEYYRLIATLESQFKSPNHSNLTLRRLVVWIREPLQRMKLLAFMISSASGLKGGSLASAIRTYRNHGDPFVKTFVNQMLTKVSKPIFNMIQSWVFEGELIDPHHEFFVASDNSVPLEKLWFDKYTIRLEMLPSFIPLEFAKKILLIGKSINFLRSSCKDTELTINKQTITAQVENLEYFSSEEGNKVLEQLVQKAGELVNKHLMSVIFDKYKLYDHALAIKRYLLLGQGDFIQCLMDLLGTDLSKPANTIIRSNLLGTLESAIRSSNAQFDDQEFLDRLGIKLFEGKSSALDYGWDIFSLDYRVDVPISTIITPDSMETYLKIFSFLWRIKRVDYSLNSTWRRHMNVEHAVRTLREIAGDLHKCHLLRNEMVHFISNLQYYIMFEVLEYSWQELVKEMKQASDLDVVIGAHSKYLSYITDKLLLTSFSENLQKDLKNLLEVILRFCRIQDHIYITALENASRKSNNEAVQYGSDLRDKFGLDEEEEQEEEEKPPVDYRLSPEIKQQLEMISQDYSSLFKSFTNQLSKRDDENLRFLTFRFDFNGYYERKERRAVSPKASDNFASEDNEN